MSRYPKLGALSQSSFVNIPVSNTIIFNNDRTETDINNKIYDIIYANGYFVVCGRDSYDGAFIAYSTNINGPYNKTSIRNIVGKYSDINITCNVCYGNGYFVMGGATTSDNGYTNYNNHYIFYTTNPADGWHAKLIYSDNSYLTEIHRMRFVNGYFVACCGHQFVTNRDSATLFYTQNPAGVWTEKVLWRNDSLNSYGLRVFDITYTNNVYCCIGSFIESSNPGNGGYIILATGNSIEDIYSNGSYKIIKSKNIKIKYHNTNELDAVNLSLYDNKLVITATNSLSTGNCIMFIDNNKINLSINTLSEVEDINTINIDLKNVYKSGILNNKFVVSSSNGYRQYNTLTSSDVELQSNYKPNAIIYHNDSYYGMENSTLYSIDNRYSQTPNIPDIGEVKAYIKAE